MKLNYRTLTAALSATALLACSQAVVFAGTAPPNNSPGGSLAPDTAPVTAGTDTSGDVRVKGVPGPKGVRLDSERTVIDVQSPAPADMTVQTDADASDTIHAAVTSNYQIRNTTDAIVTLPVRFPLSDLTGVKNRQGVVPEAQGFTASVDGVEAPITIITTTNPAGEGEPPLKWATFEIVLNPNQTVGVVTQYQAPATGQIPLAKFNYALETASGWGDRVGSAEVVLKLPYPANKENVMLADSNSGAKIDGNTVTWLRRNFKPSAKDNLAIVLLSPQRWLQIDKARQESAQDDGGTPAERAQRLRDLAQAYADSVALENGVPSGASAQFVNKAEAAYEQAIKLNPESADLHAEYATLLSEFHLAADLGTVRAVGRLGEIADQVEGALKIDPKNAAALSLLAQVKQLAADQANRDGSRRAVTLLSRVDAIATNTGAVLPNAANPEPTPVAGSAPVSGTAPAATPGGTIQIGATPVVASAPTKPPSAAPATALPGADPSTGASGTAVAPGGTVTTTVPATGTTAAATSEPAGAVTATVGAEATSGALSSAIGPNVTVSGTIEAGAAPAPNVADATAVAAGTAQAGTPVAEPGRTNVGFFQPGTISGYLWWSICAVVGVALLALLMLVGLGRRADKQKTEHFSESQYTSSVKKDKKNGS